MSAKTSLSFKIILTIIIIIAAVIVFLMVNPLYIVDQNSQAVVLRFGQIMGIEKEPGLHFKVPFLDNVEQFEKRIMIYDIPAERVITADKKTIVTDTYALWRIKDPKLFIETVKTPELALSRIDDIVYSHVRDIIAKYNFEEVLNTKREVIYHEVLVRTKKDIAKIGVDIIDVRVKKTELPTENAEAVYNRMKAERFSIATQIRAEGERESLKITSEADKQVKIIEATAKKKSEIIKGTADASVIQIYAGAFGIDPKFYELQKTTDIYKNSMKDSLFVLPKDSPILNLLNNMDK